MADIFSPEKRSRVMSGIRGKNTKPELIIRRALFAEGFRYRLHDKNLPGHPDLVLPKYKTVIFVNGCFWHGHDCVLFKMPSTNMAFWEHKININKSNDARNMGLLLASGWKVAIVWECTMKGSLKLEMNILVGALSKFIKYGDTASCFEIRHM